MASTPAWMHGPICWIYSLIMWAYSLLIGSLTHVAFTSDKPQLTTSSIGPILPEDGRPPESPLKHTCTSFASAVTSRLGRGGVLAKAMYRGYFAAAALGQEFDLPPELAASSAALAARVVGLTALMGELPLTFMNDALPPKAGCTEKYVLRCVGGEEIEMVAMPAPGGPDAGWSLCISSQVGCRMGCKFCETGKMGLLRNLRVEEIVCQVALAARSLQLRVANVVFMGMGEPLDNVDAVIGAIRVITDPTGLNIPLSHVTVSTSGVAQHVYTLLAALPSVRLAFSLHAANDELRTRLMPINSKVQLAELAKAMSTYLSKTKRRVTIQYVLLADVNDSDAHAAELATFLATVGPLARLHVNLIPYNAQSGPALFRAPDHEACKAFKTSLQSLGLFTKIRVEKGAEKMAACGQLGNVRLRRELNARRFAEASVADEDQQHEQQARQPQPHGRRPQQGASAAQLEGEEPQEIAEEASQLAVAAAATAQVQAAVDAERQTNASSLCGRKDLEW